MSTLADARFEALRGLGLAGATNDMLLKWLQNNGATSNSLPDAWKEFLIAQGFVGDYQKNDAWAGFLIAAGYSGALPDMELAFWRGGAIIPLDVGSFSSGFSTGFS